MSARIVSTCLLLTAWLAFPALVQGQEPPDYLTKAEFEKWKKEVFEPLKKRVDTIEPKVEALVEIAANQDAKLGAIAKDVSEGGLATWVPDIRRAWESQEFREDMGFAVHDSMLRQGSLTIQNKTAVGHTLLVNHSEYVYVGPGETRVVQGIPVGTVSTELVGYERPRNWTLGPPNYEQRIDIVPNSPTQVVVARPTTIYPTVRTAYSPVYPTVTTVYSPVYSPVVVDSPILVGPSVLVDPPVIYWW